MSTIARTGLENKKPFPKGDDGLHFAAWNKAATAAGRTHDARRAPNMAANNNGPEAPPSVNAPPNCEGPDTTGLPPEALKGMTPRELVGKVLERGCRGVIIGEPDHLNPEYPGAVGEMMETFAQHGVNTLYVELQKEVMERPDGSLLDGKPGRQAELETYFRNLPGGYVSQERAKAFAGMVQKAVDLGMRVVPIDSPTVSMAGPRQLSQDQRIREANILWAGTINGDSDRGGRKFVAFVGDAHLGEGDMNDMTSQDKGLGPIASVQRLLGVVAIAYPPAFQIPEPTSPYNGAHPTKDEIPPDGVVRGYYHYDSKGKPIPNGAHYYVPSRL